MIKVEAKTVVANEGGFEPHPESYTPRVFAKVPTNAYSNFIEPTVYKVYEILGNGQSVEWPTLPPTDCGFDYWSFLLLRLGNVTMGRAARSVPRPISLATGLYPAPTIPPEVWEALSQDPVPQADGDCPNPDVCGCGQFSESGHLSHLPEGSH